MARAPACAAYTADDGRRGGRSAAGRGGRGPAPPSAVSQPRATSSSKLVGRASAGVRLSIIPAISAVVEHQAAVQRFELFAGRAACLGFATAVLVETTGGPLLGLTLGDATTFLEVLTGAVAGGVAASAVARRAGDSRLIEAVFASLTSTAGSASSAFSTVPVPRYLDQAVDIVMASAFDSDMTSFLQASMAEAEADEI